MPQLFRRSKKADGTIVVRTESVAGNGIPDLETTLPAGAVPARVGVRQALRYNTEAIRQVNHVQFGTSKYFDPNFVFSVDKRPSNLSLDDMRARGQNLFCDFSTTDPEKAGLPYPQRFIYATESGLHGVYEGVRYYEASLETMEDYYNASSVAGAGQGYWCANIETSNEWWPGNNGNAIAGFSHVGYYGTSRNPQSWESARGNTIRMESNGGEAVTLGQLADRGEGAWQSEMITRRTNRCKVMLQVAARKSSGRGYNAYGASMYQGAPDLHRAYSTNVFQDGGGNASAFSNDGNGNVMLNGRSYNLNGDLYKHESFFLDYYYAFTFNIPQADYEAIWVRQESDKINFPYIWSRMSPEHVVADQVGHFQCNEYRMKRREGNQNRGVMVMREILYESGGVVPELGYNTIVSYCPPAMNAGYIDFGDGGSPQDDSVKIWIPPYIHYSYYVCARFFYANRPGSGFHMWNVPGRVDFANDPGANHHLHSVTALFQARHDMQVYEKFLGLSTMIEQPEVQPNQSGAYAAYDAIAAFNYDDGVKGPQKPVFLVRYLAQTGGFRVLILGGMKQDHSAERTDNVRFSLPGMSSPVTVAVKLKGPSAQVYELSVRTTDAGQSFTATPTFESGYARAGYAGRTAV